MKDDISEIKAMGEVYDSMKNLDDDSKIRILQWLISKFGMSTEQLKLGNQSIEEIPFVKRKTEEDEKKGNVKLIDFYSQFEPNKPSDSVLFLTAWLYKNRGKKEFSINEIQSLFDEIGEPRPDRIDMTLKAAQRNGKKLYQNIAKGKYKPTLNGEIFFKNLLNPKTK